MSEVPTVPVAVRERGYATEDNGSSWWTTMSREKTPELRWPACLDVYEDMATQDAQVSSVLRAVSTPILRTPWRVDGTGCRPEVTAHVARDLGLPVVGEGNDVPATRTRDRFSWTSHLAVALEDTLQFGHACFEQVYRIEPDGLAHLRKLGYRPPRTIAKFNVARDGGLVSIEQRGTLSSTTRGRSTGTTLPVARLVVYVHGRKGGNWTGRSLLRPAYKHWLIKDRLLRVDAQSIDRNGMGVPVYTAAEHETSLAAGEKLATSVRSGDSSGAAIPNGAELELKGVEGTLPKALDSVKYHDEQIARAVLAHFLNLGSQTGSWALGSTFADFFTLSLQAVADLMRVTANQHVVEDIVDINYGPDEPAPQIVFDEIGSRAESVVNAIAVLVNAGVLSADEDLEGFIRTSLGLPNHDRSVPTPDPVEEPS